MLHESTHKENHHEKVNHRSRRRPRRSFHQRHRICRRQTPDENPDPDQVRHLREVTTTSHPKKSHPFQLGIGGFFVTDPEYSEPFPERVVELGILIEIPNHCADARFFQG